MAAHSLNSAKMAQFQERVGSYSTHGSRRGFVDIPLPIPKDQLNDAREEYLQLREERVALDSKILAIKGELGLQHKPSHYLSEKGDCPISKRAAWTENRHNKFQEYRQLGQRQQIVQESLQILRQRLMVMDEPADNLEHTAVTKKGVKIPFRISRSKYIQNTVFYQLCCANMDRDTIKTLNKMASEFISHIEEGNNNAE